eukprot:UN32057
MKRDLPTEGNPAKKVKFNVEESKSEGNPAKKVKFNVEESTTPKEPKSGCCAEFQKGCCDKNNTDNEKDENEEKFKYGNFDYWSKRYGDKEYKEEFEWYYDFESLCGLFGEYVDADCGTILSLGNGSSRLPIDLAENNIGQNIIALDYCENINK